MPGVVLLTAAAYRNCCSGEIQRSWDQVADAKQSPHLPCPPSPPLPNELWEQRQLLSFSLLEKVWRQ